MGTIQDDSYQRATGRSYLATWVGWGIRRLPGRGAQWIWLGRVGQGEGIPEAAAQAKVWCEVGVERMWLGWGRRVGGTKSKWS